MGAGPSAQGIVLRLPSGESLDLRTEDYGRGLIEERHRAERIANPYLRERRVVLTKGIAVSGGWGIFAREDRHRLPRGAESLAIGPTGAKLRITSGSADVAGPFTLWHLAAAIPAACDAIVAIASHDIEALGGTVAAVMTDSIVVPLSTEGGLVPCPGGSHQLGDGLEAIRCLTPAEFRSVLARADKVLHPRGGAAWKIEGDTLDKPTVGFVVGVNKVLLGRREEDGRFHLVRSSDTGMGDHFLDPTGTGEYLDDGRTGWSARLEESFLADVIARGNDAPLRVPQDLPEWADFPALRPRHASTLDELRRLRRQVGDPTVAPFTRYVTAACGVEHPPVCLGVARDPATWRVWPWHRDGARCRIGVLDRAGKLVEADGEGPLFVVATIRDIFRDWLNELDVTVGGPKRGLRHVLPVRSHPALVEVVGRSGERAGERSEDDPIVFSSGGMGTLLAEASQLSGRGACTA
jgi:hypothetical protein